MKIAIFAAAALIASGTAVAQTRPQAQPMQNQPQTQTRTQAGAQGQMDMRAGSRSANTDSRGIPVVSNPATPPAGANQAVQAPAGAQLVPAPNQSQVFQPRQAQQEYPPCTREVTDGCIQAYEPRLRGRAPRR